MTGIPATGGDLVITGYLLPATDSVTLYLRLNNYSGATDYEVAGSAISTAAAEVLFGSTGGAQIAINAGNNIGNVATEGISFHVTIPNYGQLVAAEFVYGQWLAAFRDPSSITFSVRGGFSLDKAEAINRVTLLFSSGNIASGRVRIYTTGD